VVAAIPAALRGDIETLWDYHDMHHELRPVDVGIGLGSHDLGVAIHATDLYHRGYFPSVVFTGANAPTTVQRFPQGEAAHYRTYAIEHGIPDRAILADHQAKNTSENIENARKLLIENGFEICSAILVSRPYQQRRAYATAKKIWPEVDVLCSSERLSLDHYFESIGDAGKVINMLVGDTQRIGIYAEKGFAIAQEIPTSVDGAYRRLVSAGFTERLI
jgi:uncharacterized SAM-binding protein YcdF (DUF218 family)